MNWKQQRRLVSRMQHKVRPVAPQHPQAQQVQSWPQEPCTCPCRLTAAARHSQGSSSRRVARTACWHRSGSTRALHSWQRACRPHSCRRMSWLQLRVVLSPLAASRVPATLHQEWQGHQERRVYCQGQRRMGTPLAGPLLWQRLRLLLLPCCLQGGQRLVLLGSQMGCPVAMRQSQQRWQTPGVVFPASHP